MSEHEVTPDGESTSNWAMCAPGFFGTVRVLLDCARCGEKMPPGRNVKRRTSLTPFLHFLCDACFDALPSSSEPVK